MNGETGRAGVGEVVAGGEGVTCFECLYDLRGQAVEGVCPECGAAVRGSMDGGRWDRADVRWRRRVRWGLAWAAGEYLVVLAVAGALVLAGFDSMWVGVGLYGTMGAGAVVGGWMVTAREPGVAGTVGLWWRRMVVRGLAVAVGTGYAIIVTELLLRLMGKPSMGWWLEGWVVALVGAANGVKQVVQLAHVGWVVGRVPGRPLAVARWACPWAPLAAWWALVVMWWAGTVNSGLWRVMVVVVLVGFAVTVGYECVVWWVLRPGRGRVA